MADVVFRHAHDPGRGRLDRQPKRGRDFLEHRALGEAAVESESAFGVNPGAKAPHDQLRVGNSWFGSAAAVAGRSRFGSRSLGTDVQYPRLVERGDTTSSGADRMDIDRGDDGFVVADVQAVGHGNLAVRHEHQVATGPADFHRNEIYPADEAAVVAQRADGGGGTGERLGDRFARHLVEQRRSAVVLDQKRRSARRPRSVNCCCRTRKYEINLGAT